LKKNKAYQSKHRGVYRARSLKWQKDNRKDCNLYASKWRWNNREKYKKKYNEWTDSNKGLRREGVARRRAKKLRATPNWVDLEKIKEIYKNCPDGYQVDHIIPLQGKNVSGLHVPENLQYLTPYDNQSKGHKFNG